MDLRVSNLSVSYGSFQALRDVSFSVAKGELFTFLGPSGSGKSTLLLCLAGFLPPQAGAIVLAGHDITLTPPNRRDIGMVFQSYTLFPHKSVFSNIAYPLQLRKQSKDEVERRVSDMLNLLHLEGHERRLPHQLSGGQQQRVALARALVFSPRLLLLDEPLGALDKKLREEMQPEIRRIQRASKSTLIYVTHDQKEAMAMSDRIAILCDGQIQQIGTPRQIYDNPANAFVADFFGESNLADVRVVRLNESTCDVDLAGSEITGVPKPSWLRAPGGWAKLMIRQEHVCLCKGTTQGENELPCRVEEQSFLGDATVSQCLVKNQTRFVVRQSAEKQLDLRPGEQGWLQIPSAKTKLFEI